MPSGPMPMKTQVSPVNCAPDRTYAAASEFLTDPMRAAMFRFRATG
jgi:hypothetical protein